MQLRIIADENVHFRIVKELRNNGFHVISVLEDYQGFSDKDILQLALHEQAILLTEDKDFGEWVFAHKEKNTGVIFLRYKFNEVKDISKSLLGLLLKYGDGLYNKFAAITAHKIRIRDLL